MEVVIWNGGKLSSGILSPTHPNRAFEVNHALCLFHILVTDVMLHLHV